MNRWSSSSFTPLRCVWLAVAAGLLFPLAGLAQDETYVYPGTAAGTDFTIGNINEEAVNASVTFYTASTGEATPHAFILQPGTQTRFTPESLGLDEDFDGSTIITSALPLAITVTVSEEDDYEHLTPAESSVELVIPFGAFGGAISELIVFNPGDNDARVRMIQVGEDGNSLGFLDRVVEPKETIRERTSGSDTNIRYIVIRTSNFFVGGTPVAAAALERVFVPPSGGQNNFDLSYVPGRPAASEPSSTRIPLFIQGEGFLSTLQVINDSRAPQTITLGAVDLNGDPIEGSNNPATIQLGGRAEVSESVGDLFDISETSLHYGAITIQGEARLSAEVAVGGTTRPFVTKVPPAPAARDTFAYQIRQVGREFSWLLSLFNPGTSQANLDMTFILDDGTVVSSVDLTIPAGTQITPTLASIFPEAQGDGFVLFESDVPIEAGGIELRQDREAASYVRALPAAMSFMADDPTELFAVGTVRSNGEGLDNVTVTLTGPSSATTLTDAAGTFLFPDLPAGAYTISAQRIGFAITPPQIDFAIDTESSRNNDFTAALITPVITTLTPTGATVGSADTDIVIEGGPFIAGSVIVLGTTELPATVVNSQTLFATVPASMLKNPLQLSLKVRNYGLAGDFVDSAAVMFSVGNPPPVLTTLSGQPNPLIAGSTAFTLTVDGVGFLPGVTIFLDQTPKPALFISDSRVTVQVDDADVAVGGFIPVRALNPGPAVLSNALDLVVLNPPPEITSITPNTADVSLLPSLPPLALTVTGSGFQEDATVLVDGTPVLTDFVSSTMLTGSIPATLMSVSGVRDIQVANPEPSQGPSFAFPLTLTNPLPILTSVEGDVVFPGSPLTAPILLQGAQFASNSTVWMSAPCGDPTFVQLPNFTVPEGQEQVFGTRRLSPSTITASMNVECAGDYVFQVRSPQPGGGISDNQTLTVP